MKIYRFSVFLVFITLVALLYVHQQVELLTISYRINSNEKETARLLDQNRSLVYNVTQLKSPVYLEKRFLTTKKDFIIPQQWSVVKLATPQQTSRPVVIANTKKRSVGIFSKIFGRPKEAMANPVK